MVTGLPRIATSPKKASLGVASLQSRDVAARRDTLKNLLGPESLAEGGGGGGP